MSLLNSIKINNFRNLKNINLEFQPGYNLLIGENGQGKTNTLEAIYFLSLLRSFRTSTVSNLKSWNNSDLFFVSGEVETPLGNKLLKVGYGEKRIISINNSEIAKASEFIGKLICIVFSPDDIKLVDGSGKARRRFIDITLSQLSKTYLFALQGFNNALKNRNALLKKSKQMDISKVLNSFDKLMIEYAAEIHLQRLAFIEAINGHLEEKSKVFYHEKKKLGINFITTTAPKSLEDKDEVMASYKTALQNNLERDLLRGTTSVGPHRDDFSLNLNRKSLKNYGSQGECRLASLLLRLSCSEFFLENSSCVFLVDDVTGELDEHIKKVFFELLEKGEQVFFAATEIPENLKEREDVKVFNVIDGLIEEV